MDVEDLNRDEIKPASASSAVKIVFASFCDQCWMAECEFFVRNDLEHPQVFKSAL